MGWRFVLAQDCGGCTTQDAGSSPIVCMPVRMHVCMHMYVRISEQIGIEFCGKTAGISCTNAASSTILLPVVNDRCWWRRYGPKLPRR